MLGPLFRIEMLMSARRTRQFYVRAVYALVLFASLWGVYEAHVGPRGAMRIQDIANVGASFFQVFAVLQMLAVLLVAPAVAAGTVAVERERRTIEYLFATDLSNAEIVIGKLLARTLQVTWHLLTGLPLLALVMLMGGVAPEQLVVMFLITVAALISVNVLSVTVSVWTPRVRDSIRRVYMLIFLLLVLPPLLFTSVSVWSAGGPIAQVAGFLLMFNPLTVILQVALGAWWLGNASPWAAAWTFVIGHLAFSLLFAGASVWAVRRVHLAGDGPKPGKKQRMAPHRPGPGEQPMVWKELLAARGRKRGGIVGRIFAVLLAAGCLAPGVVSFAYSAGAETGGITVFTSTLWACAALLMLGARAAASVTREREQDTWVTLMTTPLTAVDIVWGKFVGNLDTLRGPLMLLGLIWAVYLIQRPQFIVGCLLALGMIALLAVTVTLIGIAFSVRGKNTTRATGMTIFALLVLGGGYLTLLAPFIPFMGSDDNAVLALVAPFLIGAPQMIVYEAIEYSSFGRATPWAARFVGICTVGALAYASIAAVVWTTLTREFERSTGRIARRSERA